MAMTGGFRGGAEAGAKMAAKVRSGRLTKFAAAHPFKTGAGVMAGLGVAKYVTSGRRGRGTDKVAGRSTGMYKY